MFRRTHYNVRPIADSYTGVPHTLAKIAICYCIFRSLWLLVPGPSSQFFYITILYETCFNVSSDWIGDTR